MRSSVWFPRLAVGLSVGVLLVLLGLLYAENPEGRSLVPVCQFRALTGLHCPGCGATRATYHLLHGRLGTAFYYNPLYVSLLPLLLVWGAWWARGWWHGHQLTPRQVRRQAWLGGSLLVLLLVFGVVRNLPGWPWW